MNEKQRQYLYAFLIFLIFAAIFTYTVSVKSEEDFNKKIEEMTAQDLKIIEASNGENACDTLTGEKKESCLASKKSCEDDECLLTQARVNKDEKQCLQIKDEELRATCGASVFRDRVFRDAVLKNDVSLCEAFLDDSGKKSCRDNFYYTSAKNKQDVTFCEFILDEVIKNECLQ